MSDIQNSEKECYACKTLERGDSLYHYCSDEMFSDGSGEVVYDVIHEIKYCPLCGKELSGFD